MDPLSVLGLASSAIQPVRKLVRGSLNVQPKKLSFGGSEWEQVWALAVTSLSDVPLYEVVIGVWSDDRPVVTELPIELVDLNGAPMGPMTAGAAQVEMDTGCAVLHGNAGAHGVMLIFLHHVDPGQTVRLGMRSKAKMRFHVFTEALHLTKLPSGPVYAIGPDGQPAVRVHLPIDLSVSSMSLYVRRL